MRPRTDIKQTLCAVRDALALIEEPRPVLHSALVSPANLSLLSEQAYAQILHTLTRIEAHIAAVEAAQYEPPLPRPARGVFSYALRLLEAERQWLATRIEVPDDEQD